MKIDIKVPQAGESVTEAMISEWFVEDGATVGKDDVLLELETDKANMELNADEAGVLHRAVAAGEVVKVGQVIGTIDTEASGSPARPSTATGKKETASAAQPEPQREAEDRPLAPSVRRIVTEEGLDPGTIKGSGKAGRITKGDALAAAKPEPGEEAPKSAVEAKPERGEEAPKSAVEAKPGSGAGTQAAKGKVVDIHLAAPPAEREKTVPMSMMRRRIAQRLVEAQQTAAILTTFNEVDMSAVMALREKYKDAFAKKFAIKLGFMSFFVKAAVEALKAVPEINAMVDGQNIVYRNYQDIGVAVGSQKGLVVPVVRDADQLSFAEIEQTIADFGVRAQNGKLSLDELSGGTFTISNGGIYGSLLSTPILNPPQSGILGMHKIEKRPVVVDDQVVIRPMMYLALSYDHRIVDGKGAVTFLVALKECIEDPARMLLGI